MSVNGFLIKDYGPGVIILEWPPDISQTTLRRVITMNHYMKTGFPGVKELIPSYHSMAIVFDTHVTSKQLMREQIDKILTSPEQQSVASRHWKIPVCYDEEFALDWRRMEEHTDLDFSSVILRHTEPIYDVYAIGFLPGFAYLGVVDASIALARHKRPRLSVPRGSVGIANQQTGVYPSESPGGWNIIGKTSFSFFNVQANPPSTLQPGDTVKFIKVNKDALSQNQSRQ